MSRLRAPVITPNDRRVVGDLRSAPPLGRDEAMWAVASGSGGVGRSTVAALLAAGLVRRGRTVCLVDADWTGPALAPLLDVPVPLRGDPWSAAEPEAVFTPLHDDLVLLPGVGPMSGDPSRRACRRLVGRLRARSEERVVVDLPGGTTDRALDLWLASDVPVLVTVPERIPLEATFRLLARVFARMVRPWLDRKLGREAAGVALDEGWERAEGRAGTWMRSIARAAQLVPDEIAEAVGRRPLYLVLNRVRRGDDVDVGHALVTAAGHGLGLDVRFRGVISEDEDGWIRARRAAGAQNAGFSECLSADVHELIDRIVRDVEVAPPGDLLWDLKDAAALVGNAGRRNRPPWR